MPIIPTSVGSTTSGFVGPTIVGFLFRALTQLGYLHAEVLAYAILEGDLVARQNLLTATLAAMPVLDGVAAVEAAIVADVLLYAIVEGIPVAEAVLGAEVRVSQVVQGRLRVQTATTAEVVAEEAVLAGRLRAYPSVTGEVRVRAVLSGTPKVRGV